MTFRFGLRFALMGVICLCAGSYADTATGSKEPAALKVRLQESGSLAGRLQMVYPTGKALPAQAKIAFSQEGDLVDSATTNEEGEFELAQLAPGTYNATAVAADNATDFQVDVLAYDPAAKPEEMLMQGTLTPVAEEMAVAETGRKICDKCGGEILPEGEVLLEGDELVGDLCTCGEEVLVEEEIIAEPCCAMGACCPPTGGFGGGGGGCGGKGLGLLGLGGLAAGLTALAVDNNGNNVVSPYHN